MKGPSPQRRVLRRSEGSFAAAKGPSPQRRVLRNGEATHISGLFKYPRRPFLSLPPFLLHPFVSCTSCVHFFSDFEPSVTTMAPKKTVPAKRRRSGSTSRVAPPPPDDLRRFISWEAERLYHESLCIRSFIPERGFPTSNAFFNFTIQSRGW